MNTAAGNLYLNPDDRRLLGVCSGFARYLDVPSALVRIIFVIACLTWPTLIVTYFVAYWFMKAPADDERKDRTYKKKESFFARSKTGSHFRGLNYRKPVYRTTDNARIAGVCGGIARYLDISPFIVRLLTFLSLFVFGPFTFTAYLVCWFIMDKPPQGFSWESYTVESPVPDPGAGAAEATTAAGQESFQEYNLEKCAENFGEVEARLRQMEAFITSSQFRLHCELNRI